MMSMQKSVGLLGQNICNLFLYPIFGIIRTIEIIKIKLEVKNYGRDKRTKRYRTQ